MEFIKTKSILNKVSYGEEWYGIDYNMNLYRGCCHGCIYCDSRSNCYQIDHFDTVRGKENALSILEQELSRKKNKGVVGIGSMSDTYNPMEKVYEQTRGALKLLSKYAFGVSIDTKSDLITRDIDLLKQISAKNNVIIKLTITTPDDDLSKKIEPNVCVSSRRFQAIRTLADNGIFAGIIMNPVLPFITDKQEDIIKLIELAHSAGAKFIHTYMGVTLRENQRDYYYEKLDRLFPGLKAKYVQRYRNSYNCLVPSYDSLYTVFKAECRKRGILYEMSDIINAYKINKGNQQIQLF